MKWITGKTGWAGCRVWVCQTEKGWLARLHRPGAVFVTPMMFAQAGPFKTQKQAEATLRSFLDDVAEAYNEDHF